MSISDEARAILQQPAFASLATIGADGAPQATVVWFRLAGDELRIVAPLSTQKVRNLQRDPRVALTVGDRQDAYRYVILRGRAELSNDPDLIRSELSQIAEHYIGAKAQAFVAVRDMRARALIRIHPDRVQFSVQRIE